MNARPKAGETTDKWTVFALVAIGVFMATLDSSIVNISLPAIAAHFHVPLNGAVEWVIIGYLVVIAGALLTAGRLADVIGRKPLCIVGLGLFQSPNASALLGSAPPDRRGIASGVFATGRVVGQSLSVALAGAVFAGAGGSQAGRALLHADPNQAAQLRDQLTSAFRLTFLTCAAVAAIGVVTSLIRGPEDRPGRKPSAELRSRAGAGVA